MNNGERFKQEGYGFDSDSVFGFALDSVRLDSVVIRIWLIRIRFRWDSIRIWSGRSRYDSIRIRFGFVWESVRLGFDLEFGLEFGLGFGLGFGTTCRKMTFL